MDLFNCIGAIDRDGKVKINKFCGCSSPGRARASQARGRGFESRRPLYV